MTPNRLFILLASLAALLAGMQTRRQDCPACVLLPKTPKAAPDTDLKSTASKP